MMQKLFILIFLLPTTALFGHGVSSADKASLLAGGHIDYIRLGAVHMLTGYDHLLFLLGVIFFLTNTKDIIKFISAFTIGHSITLIIGTIFNISANYFLVDAIIALSICYKGFENSDGFKKHLNINSPNIVFVVFLFGLIHGFGLSTRFQQLALSHDGLIMKIVSFNIGVEIGQVLALVGIILVLSSWRKTKSFKVFSTFANRLLILAGFLLFIFQMHGYIHAKKPDEFGFSRNNHRHAHEEVQYKKYQNKFKNKPHNHGRATHSH